MSSCNLLSSTYLSGDLQFLENQQDDIFSFFSSESQGQSISPTMLDDEFSLFIRDPSEEPTWIQLAPNQALNEVLAIDFSTDPPFPITRFCSADEIAMTQNPGSSQDLTEVSTNQDIVLNVSSMRSEVAAYEQPVSHTTAENIPAAVIKPSYIVPRTEMEKVPMTITSPQEMIIRKEECNRNTEDSGPAHKVELLGPFPIFEIKNAGSVNSLPWDFAPSDELREHQRPMTIGNFVRPEAESCKSKDGSLMTISEKPVLFDVIRNQVDTGSESHSKLDPDIPEVVSHCIMCPFEPIGSRSVIQAKKRSREERESAEPGTPESSITMDEDPGRIHGECDNASNSFRSLENGSDDRLTPPITSKDVEEGGISTVKLPPSALRSKLSRPSSKFVRFRDPPKTGHRHAKSDS